MTHKGSGLETTDVSLFVPGVPAPGGSKTVFRTPSGKVNVTDAGGERNKNWRAVVATVAYAHFRGLPMDGPLEVSVVFVMPRPKSHFRRNGTLRPNAPRLHTNKPDATKLWRSTEDALTGILWRDDSTICRQAVEKVYGDVPGARLTVRRLVTEAVIVS